MVVAHREFVIYAPRIGAVWGTFQGEVERRERITIVSVRCGGGESAKTEPVVAVAPAAATRRQRVTSNLAGVRISISCVLAFGFDRLSSGEGASIAQVLPHGSVPVPYRRAQGEVRRQAPACG